MIVIITICLVLITIAVLFGSNVASELLGCLVKLLFWGFIIAVVGFVLILISS